MCCTAGRSVARLAAVNVDDEVGVDDGSVVVVVGVRR